MESRNSLQKIWISNLADSRYVLAISGLVLKYLCTCDLVATISYTVWCGVMLGMVWDDNIGMVWILGCGNRGCESDLSRVSVQLPLPLLLLLPCPWVSTRRREQQQQQQQEDGAMYNPNSLHALYTDSNVIHGGGMSNRQFHVIHGSCTYSSIRCTNSLLRSVLWAVRGARKINIAVLTRDDELDVVPRRPYSWLTCLGYDSAAGEIGGKIFLSNCAKKTNTHNLN